MGPQQTNIPEGKEVQEGPKQGSEWNCAMTETFYSDPAACPEACCGIGMGVPPVFFLCLARSSIPLALCLWQKRCLNRFR